VYQQSSRLLFGLHILSYRNPKTFEESDPWRDRWTVHDSSQGLWRFTFVENNATASQQHCVYGARRTSLQLEVKEGPDLRYLSQISALKLIMNATILGMSNKRLRSSQTRTVLRCQRAKSRYQHQEWFQVFPNLQSWVG